MGVFVSTPQARPDDDDNDDDDDDGMIIASNGFHFVMHLIIIK